MFDLDEAKKKVKEQSAKINEYEKTAKITDKKEELEKLEKQTMESGFWNDAENSSKVLARIAELKRKIQSFSNLDEKVNTAQDMIELLAEEEDSEIEAEVNKELVQIDKSLENLEIQLHQKCSCFLKYRQKWQQLKVKSKHSLLTDRGHTEPQLKQ